MAIAQKQVYSEDDYYALPEDVRAELIDGRIYYQAAPSYKHQKILMEISGIILNYIKSNGGSCEVLPAPFSVKLQEDSKNIVEPDISVICNKDKMTDKGYNGAPDWIIEIVSPSSRRMDYFIKLFKYRTAGVREYWIVDPEKRRITTYLFENEDGNEYTFSDKVKSNIYKDFEIDFSEIIFE